MFPLFFFGGILVLVFIVWILNKMTGGDKNSPAVEIKKKTFDVLGLPIKELRSNLTDYVWDDWIVSPDYVMLFKTGAVQL